MKNIFIANITIKALSPFKVGSSDKDFLIDSPIQKDWNNIPMILGTSLAGILRKEFNKDKANDFFGDEDSKDGAASRVVISNALLLDSNKKVHEELLLEKSPFLKEFDNLVLREHTAINDKGVAVEHSKFDEEIVFTGSKFKFMLSLLSNDKDEAEFKEILEKLSLNSLRIGGGGSKGFGKFEVEDINYDIFDMSSDEFANFKNSLNTKFTKKFDVKHENSKAYISYNVTLKSDDFFIFGSGFGDGDADDTQVFEKIVNDSYDGFTSKKVLIPASSIKGALAHRTTFYYNKLKGIYIGNGETPYKQVEAIFGSKKDKDEKGSKGNIIISDLYLEQYEEKVFDHVAIDRFTGGGIDGALFQEKAINTKEKIKLEILLKNDIEDEAKKAFELALNDLVSGQLSLGGASSKGHGIFIGEWENANK